jgi:ABC-type sugar transport system substrate-binding protein
MNPIKRRRQHGRSSNWRNEAAALVAAAATAALAFSPVDALASPAPHLIRERASARLLLGGVAADDVDPYFISIECGAKAEAKAEGVNLHWSGTASTAVGDETSVLNSRRSNPTVSSWRRFRTRPS